MGIKIKFREFGVPKVHPGDHRAQKPWHILYLLEQMGIELEIPDDQLKKYIDSSRGVMVEELFIHLPKETRSKVVPLIVERGKKFRFPSRGFVSLFLDELSLEELETHLLDILDWINTPTNQHLLTVLRKIKDEDLLRKVYHKKNSEKKIKTFILKKLPSAALGLTDPNEGIRETAKALVNGKRPRTTNYENRIRKGIRDIMNAFIDLWGGEQIKQNYAFYRTDYQYSQDSPKAVRVQWKQINQNRVQIPDDQICISLLVELKPGWLSSTSFLPFPDLPKNIEAENIRNHYRNHISYLFFKKKEYKDFLAYIKKNLEEILTNIIKVSE